MDVVTYALCKKIISSVASGISDISVNGTDLIFTTNDGKTITVGLPVPQDGVSITKVKINNDNHLICVYSNGKTEDVGLVNTVKGDKGDSGVSPTIAISPINNGHKVSITDINGTQEFNIMNGVNGITDYNDLTNKPDIPVPSEVIDSNSTNETVSTSKAVFDYVTISNNTVLVSANSYTDTAIANLVGTAPDTLNTLEELAAAVQNNETVVEALDSAITNKADKTEVVSGIKGEHEVEYRKGNVNITQSDIGLVFDGLVLKNKTVGEAKEIIANTYLSNPDRFGVFMQVPSDLIEKWDDDDYVLSAGSVCQITPIGTVTEVYNTGKLYGRFLITTYFGGSPYIFDVSASAFGKINKILTSLDITPEMLEKLKNL